VLPAKLMAVSLFAAKLLDGLFGDWPSERPSVTPIDKLKQLKSIGERSLDLNDSHSACSDCLKDS
jgi:hypothetical protein